jgi:hypothetical protein
VSKGLGPPQWRLFFDIGEPLAVASHQLAVGPQGIQMIDKGALDVGCVLELHRFAPLDFRSSRCSMNSD